MKINFIGIGAQKCASTWIHRILSDHPDVAIYPGKQIDFFSFFYDRGYQWYEKQLGEISTKKIMGEVSTSYFADSNTPARVFLYNPDMRIVLSLRDPIERAYSNHLHEVRLKHFTGQKLNFEEGLINNPMYLMQSRYSLHLARWLTVFPINQVLVLFQENIRDEPLIQSQKLYRFLGISEKHQSRFLNEKINESRSIKYSYARGFTRRAGLLARALGIGSLVETVKKNGLVYHLRRQNEIDLRQTTPPMLPSTRMRLQEILADDVLELSRQIGIENLPWPIWQSLNDKLK